MPFSNVYRHSVVFSCLLACALPLALIGCTPSAPPSSGMAASTAAPASGAAAPDGIVIAWAEWQPAKQLETLAKDFTAETKIPVTVQQIPWSDYETKIKTAWSGQSSDYDLIIGDSQWLGKGATQGHYVELTDWAKTNVTLADINPASLAAYGEYPAKSGKLYALPFMNDATVFAYRKDLFADKKNQADFQAKYGHPLAPPKTWDEFAQIAEFFNHPDKSQYGVAVFYAKEYDGVTMGWDQILWSYGGSLCDPTGKKIDGFVNSPIAVKSLEYYANLKKFTPPGSENYYFSECLRDFQEGKVAMAESWFAFLPDLQDATKNKYLSQTGYFICPGGPAGQYISLGGQGVSVSAYSKKQDQAKQFVAWFEKEDTQKKWAKLGGLTANLKVAKSDLFLNATPYNSAFVATEPHLKDFYNTPDYSELLETSQDYLNQAVAGSMKPKDALDTIAKKEQTIVDAAGK